MFKAARTFNVNSNNLKHANSIEVAKSLNVHGLLIEAEYPIPEDILEFFTKRKANLERIAEDGEYFLRLSGIFEIKRSDVLDFLQRRIISTLSSPSPSSSSSSSSPDPVACNFQEQVQARLKILHTGYSNPRLAYDFYSSETVAKKEGEILRMSATYVPLFKLWIDSHAASGDMSLSAPSHDIIIDGSLISSEKNIRIKAGMDIKTAGSSPGEGIAKGILAELVAGKDIIFVAKRHIQLFDSVMFSGEDIDIRTNGDVELSLDHSMEWINVPLTPSLIFIYAEQLSNAIELALIEQSLKEKTENGEDQEQNNKPTKRS